MQCTNCERSTVEAAVFCNHCGTRLVITCRICNSHNPLDSKFCHLCGIGLSEATSDDFNQEQPPLVQSPISQDPPMASPAPEDPPPVTSVEDISSDLKGLSYGLKVLATDVISYCAPRIRSFGKRAKRQAEAAGSVGMAQLKEFVDHLKSSGKKYPSHTKPQHPPLHSVANLEWQYSTGAAIHCPRCGNISEPESLYCFSCGLPIDERNTAPQPGLPRYEAGNGPKYYGIPAGFWVRLAAWFIDFVVLMVPQLVLIGLWPGFGDYFDEYGSYFHWIDLVNFIGVALYYTVAVSVWQTTVGKRLLGLYVLRTDGSGIGPWRALARYFATLFSFLFFCIGYLMIGLRSDKRGLHDLMCDTAVVKK